MGGGQNPRKVNPLFKDIKEYNKYLLSLIGIFVLLLSGIISYNYTNTSYAKWSSSVESKNTIKVYVKSNLDESGANAPELTSNMIPVYYDNTSDSWKKADAKNSKEQYKWYDYNNKMWANAVTVTSTNRETYLKADVGAEISMNDINTMWVWIPRYTYTYLNTNTPEEIKIKFEIGTNSSGTIKCTDAVNGTSTTSETCIDSTNGSLKVGTSTYTHPAFWWDKNDDNIRTEGEELTGIWIGKFENSATKIPTSSTSTTESEIIIKPIVQSARNKSISYQFRDIRQMEKASNIYGFAQSNSTTFNWDGSLTGDTNNIDTHMMKNMEWGAVAYLSHSKYGRCTNGICEEITINNCSSNITGIGADTVSANQTTTTCSISKNKYNGESGMKASTTRNIYGIYDMNGGTVEYVMGNMTNSSGQFYSSSAGFNIAPQSKYYDSYTYDNLGDTTYTRGKLGDATKEMAPTDEMGNWYSDYASFLYSNRSWFMRGGNSATGVNSGIFSFTYCEGYSGSAFTSRSVLNVLD